MVGNNANLAKHPQSEWSLFTIKIPVPFLQLQTASSILDLNKKDMKNVKRTSKFLQENQI